MKILYFLNHITNSGGMERIVIDKINYLADSGYDVSLAYYGTKEDKTFYQLNENVKRLPIVRYDGDSSFIKRIFVAVKSIVAIVQIIDLVMPDVIVNANTVIASWILPFIRRKIPKIVELHFSYDGMLIMNGEIYGEHSMKASFNNWLRKKIYPLYDRCVLLTEDDKKQWKFDNAVVIPNFTVLDSSIRSDLKNKCAICVGRLSYQKNIDILVDAWSVVAESHPEWHLDVYGGGGLEDNLKQRIETLGLKDFITLKGVSNKIQEEYPKYSLFVLPSRYEGFPLVLVEAMNFGLPCVGFPIAGNTTVIQNGKNGLLAEERTPKCLANTILEIIGNEDLLKTMSNNAIDSVKRYEKENVMKMWQELFYSVAHV